MESLLLTVLSRLCRCGNMEVCKALVPSLAFSQLFSTGTHSLSILVSLSLLIIIFSVLFGDQNVS